MLKGRTALVTGGSQGIGRGIADVLHSHGATVAVTGVTAEELEDANNAGYLTYQLDVRDKEQTEAVIARAAEDLGGLSILASNAGVYPQVCIDDMTEKDFDDIFDINVKGMVYSIQAALPYLREHGKGRIVVTSSITGNYTGYPGWSHYGGTKAAQMGFVRSLAIELARDGITVNAVMPGNVVTPSLEALGQDYIDGMSKSVPRGSLGTPEDIGEAVAYLASDGAGFVNGQAIVVDGGQILPEDPGALENL